MNVVEIHEHQWCFHGILVLEGTSRHRQEWCVGCGTLRVEFRKWSYQYPDHFRKGLEEGSIIERDKHVGTMPERVFHTEKGSVLPSRLGRGLKELMEQKTYAPRVLALLKPPGTKE